jgi:Cyclopropane fatty acid synthase and related methyltransferases
MIASSLRPWPFARLDIPAPLPHIRAQAYEFRKRAGFSPSRPSGHLPGGPDISRATSPVPRACSSSGLSYRRNTVRLLSRMLALITGALFAGATALAADAPPTRQPDVIFVPTPQEVVDEMLSIAKVGPGDVLYDLGSGDGRIPITAAKRFGITAVGVDIDPQRIAEARKNAEEQGVTDKVTFIQGDLFEQDLSKATVISLYLLPSLNLKLRPTLLKLKPGTRIVSHAFDMGDWKPDQTATVNGRTVYFWTVPQQ